MIGPQLLATLDQESQTEIQELFMGRRIIHVDLDKNFLTLDTGVTVHISPNQGGCSCGGGDYELTGLAYVDNIITDVKVVNDPSGDGYSGVGYRIAVVADAVQINAVMVDGDDGNGYYGTGYVLTVYSPETHRISEEP